MRDTESSTFIICPQCRCYHVYKDPEEHSEVFFQRGTYRMECDECGEVMKVSTKVETSYRTEPLIKEEKVSPNTMTTKEFLDNLKHLGYHPRLVEETYTGDSSRIYIRCVKDKRMLAVVSVDNPYEFELTHTMSQEFWAENEKADELLQLILSYTRTNPDDR